MVQIIKKWFAKRKQLKYLKRDMAFHEKRADHYASEINFEKLYNEPVDASSFNQKRLDYHEAQFEKTFKEFNRLSNEKLKNFKV